MSDRGEVMSAVGKPCETDVGVETSAAAAQQPRPDSRAAGGDRSAPRVPSPAEANPETSTEEAPETPSDGVQATDEPTVAAGSPRKSPVGFYAFRPTTPDRPVSGSQCLPDPEPADHADENSAEIAVAGSLDAPGPPARVVSPEVSRRSEDRTEIGGETTVGPTAEDGVRLRRSERLREIRLRKNLATAESGFDRHGRSIRRRNKSRSRSRSARWRRDSSGRLTTDE